MKHLFAELVQAVSARIGVDLRIQDGVTVHADFDDFPVLVRCLPDAEQILFAVTVAAVPARGREAFFRSLLQGQYLFRDTAGATLSLDENGGVVCLQAARDIRGLTTDNFPVCLENFLALAGHWRRRCLEMGEGAEAAGDAERSAPPPPPPIPGAGYLRA